MAWVHKREFLSVSDYLNLHDADTNLQTDARALAKTLPLEKDTEQALLKLLRNMQQYQGMALAAYKQNPEQLSLVRSPTKYIDNA